MKTPGLFKLEGVVQHYAWGGSSFIPQLLSIENAENQPCAEYWMGAHDKAPAQALLNGHKVPLNDLIAQSPEEFLGHEAARRFANRLPYLFKVLDVKDMLSIQVHPTKTEAEKGFARENEMGVPLTASHRNYKDDNHKPEIMVALTDFWLLHGFRSAQEITTLLDEIEEFHTLKPYFKGGNYQKLYQYVMGLSQDEVNKVLQPLVERLIPAYEAGKLEKSSPDFWAARAAIHNPLEEGNYDRGIFSVYFFNLVNIAPGHGIFQAAGIPHAYLEGVNMELMANSDNVLRGGLTPKHIDVPELLEHTHFKAVTPEILAGDQVEETVKVYRSPAPDFELSCIQVSEDHAYQSTMTHATDILIVIDGNAKASFGEGSFDLQKGDVFLAKAHVAYLLTGSATLYKATVPF